MHKLKTIPTEAIPGALDKAERYRLLNEPREAESICRDILEADPANQDGLILLLLAQTDQFGPGFDVSLHKVQELLDRLNGEYERAYYAGVILERWGKSQLRGGTPSESAYDWLREAMVCYDRAESLAPPGNAEAIFRWNTCARIINQGLRYGTTPARRSPLNAPGFDDEVPMI